MNSRSVLAGAAALLLSAAAVPEALVLRPSVAYAQTLSEEAKAALDDETAPASLDRKELRQRMKALREAIKSGALKGAARKAARAKVKSYREALQAGRKQAGEQQAKDEEGGADGPAADGEEVDDQAAEESGTRKKAAQAEADSESAAATVDDRAAADLDTKELRKRARELREAVRSGNLKGAERKAAAEKLRAARAELKKRREGGQQQADPDDAADGDSDSDASEAANAAPADGNARRILADTKAAGDLDDKALRQRLNETRAVLASKSLATADQRELRRRLADDRKALRQRVAVRTEQEQSAEAKNETAQGNEVNTTIDNEGGIVNNSTTINNTVNNVNVIVQEQTPPERLNGRQLNQRIRTLRTALREERVDVQKVEIANRILVEDRRALRERLMRDRDRRRDEIRRLRDRNELRIDFNVAVVPPPIIAAAEVDYQAIETQLVAPPRRAPQRRYTYEQIIEDEEVREAMPGIDIDTLNFDFGSAEIRPEEVDRMDRVGEALERIVAARPDEVFIIEGHTDAVGGDGANLELSQARAEAVKAALTEYFLIEPENLRTVGLGERYLKIPTEEEEEENRRVTVRRITPLLTGEAG